MTPDKMMVRRIIVPTERKFTLELPESFIGKNVELLAFEVESSQNDLSTKVSELSGEERPSLEKLLGKFEGLTFDGQGTYVFDRDEATNYE